MKAKKGAVKVQSDFDSILDRVEDSSAVESQELGADSSDDEGVVRAASDFQKQMWDKTYRSGSLPAIANRMIRKVFPRMECMNASAATEDLQSICMEKSLRVLPQWDADKAINTAATKKQNSKFTNEEWIEQKKKNVEKSLQDNFENFMARAMWNKLKNLADTNYIEKKYGVVIRAVAFQEQMDNIVGQDFDTHSFLGGATRNHMMFNGTTKMQVEKDFDYAIDIIQKLKSTSALMKWMDTLAPQRRENLEEFMAERQNGQAAFEASIAPAVFNDEGNDDLLSEAELEKKSRRTKKSAKVS